MGGSLAPLSKKIKFAEISIVKSEIMAKICTRQNLGLLHVKFAEISIARSEIMAKIGTRRNLTTQTVTASRM